MAAVTRDSSFFSSLQSKNVIITGGSNGIGAETVRLFHAHGANVVIADLPYSQSTAEALIVSLSSRVIFIPTDILNWASMISLFKQAKEKFGSIEVVVANAGMMESKPYFDFEEDENGDLKEPTESYKIIDVNLKGTMNTVRLALYHMRSNKPAFSDGSRGSIVLISSTSGYFGGTGVASYVSSKHGVTGILRASQLAANEAGVRVNGVAPFFTPTHIVSSFSQVWADSGLPANSVHDVASAIAQVATDNNYKGACLLVFGSVFKEIENSRTELLPFWMGTDVTDLMRSARALFDRLGSYPLPKPRT